MVDWARIIGEMNLAAERRHKRLVFKEKPLLLKPKRFSRYKVCPHRHTARRCHQIGEAGLSVECQRCYASSLRVKRYISVKICSSSDERKHR